MGGLVLIAAAILCVVVVEAAARGNLGINSMMGFRFGPLMLSEEAWVAGHKAARLPMWVAGSVLAAGGAAVAIVPLGDGAAGTIVIGACVIMLVFIGIAAWLSYRAASQVLTAQYGEMDADGE